LRVETRTQIAELHRASSIPYKYGSHLLGPRAYVRAFAHFDL